MLELLVGVMHDPQFGMVLTLGAGGLLAELLADTVSRCCCPSPARTCGRTRRLRCWPLLAGSRGRPADDWEACWTPSRRC